MTILLVCLVAQFATQYKQFVNSERSILIYNELKQNNQQISQYAKNPIVLWFWRINSESSEADSLLLKTSIRRNFQLSAVLRWEAKDTNHSKEVIDKLLLAAHLDSAAVENFCSLVALGVQSRNFKTIQTAFQLPILSDFRTQLFMITNTSILVFMAIFMCAAIFVFIKTIYYLPVLSHRIGPKKPSRTIDIIKTLILLIPILVVRNIYVAFIIYAIFLTLVLTTRERNWLRLHLIGLVVLFVVSLPINNFIAFLKGDNDNYHFYEMVNYDSSVKVSADNDQEQEFLAFGLKQQGRFEEALSIYEDLYFNKRQTVAIINNLANIYILYDEPAQAESLYQRAILMGDRGEPYFNMGLLKLKNLDYLESSEYMEEARKRQFSSLQQEPVDIQPSNEDFYRLIFAEELRYSGLVKNIYMLPFILILVLSFLPIRLSPPFFCSSCNRPVCNNCLKEIEDETLCQDCFTKFKSTQNQTIEEDLRRSVGKIRRKIHKVIVYVLNILVPGAGLVYLQKHLVGLLLIFFVMLAYVPLFFSNIFIKPAGWIAFSFNPVFVHIAIFIVVLSYIISFLMIREHHANRR
jgi:tetratricopeptide (TPR) repeat protein